MLLDAVVKREPSNVVARMKLDQTKMKRKRGEPSLPSTVEEELQYNTQLRATCEEHMGRTRIQAALVPLSPGRRTAPIDALSVSSPLL